MRNDELYHYGVLGMKWGVRRYQNEDGSWTNRGKSRRRSSDGKHHKKMTAEQKAKIKKAAKYAAIGVGATGAAVGGALLAKKFGPKVYNTLKSGYIKNIKGPNLSYAQAVEKSHWNNEARDLAARLRDQATKGSSSYKMFDDMVKGYSKQNRKLFETKVRTGTGETIRKLLRKPNDFSRYGLSKEGRAAANKVLAETYEKALKTAGTVGGAVGGGALAYGGAAAMDKLFDESRDKRIARRNGQKYIKKPMNARASDYMFPNPNKKK